MHSWCEVSKKALKTNFQIFRDFLEPSLVAPVLKSNAYGHGLKEVYEALRELNPDILCVNYLREGQILRDLGYLGRIISVGPSLFSDFELAVDFKVELTVGSEELLESWLNLENKPLIHLKFDTGLSRQGLYVHKADFYAKKMEAFPSYLSGLTTHFANVEDVTSQKFADKQLEGFLKADGAFRALKLFSYQRHAAASAPSLLLKKAHFDFCRIGISLYGFWPSSSTKLSFFSENQTLLALEPVLVWKSKLTSLLKIKSGSYVGYGCSYRASRDMLVGILPVGYYEGFPRLLSNSGAYVLIRGKRCPVLGRVCMNMTILDLSAVLDAEVGDEITLIGKDQSEELNAEEIAAWAQTIQYELVTRISPELPRLIV